LQPNQHTRLVPVERLVGQKKKSALDSACPAAERLVPIAYGQAGLLFPGFALQPHLYNDWQIFSNEAHLHRNS